MWKLNYVWSLVFFSDQGLIFCHDKYLRIDCIGARRRQSIHFFTHKAKIILFWRQTVLYSYWFYHPMACICRKLTLHRVWTCPGDTRPEHNAGLPLVHSLQCNTDTILNQHSVNVSTHSWLEFRATSNKNIESMFYVSRDYTTYRIWKR